VDELIADSHAFFFSGSFEVSLNITVAAAREPELKDAVFDVVRRFRRHTEEVWIGRLSQMGVQPQVAVEAVWLINSLVRGLAVRAIWEPDPVRFGHLERMQAELVLGRLRRGD
jgi:hypothetical protein